MAFVADIHVNGSTHNHATAKPTITGDQIYRPTIVIGVGGTGTAVLKHLKDLVKKKFGSKQQTELFQFLSLDTELESLSHPQGLDVDEFVNLAETTIRGDEVIRSMMDPETAPIYQGLREWWPMYEQDKPFFPGDITHGAKATRCVGRLAFWYRGMDVYRAIERKIRTTLAVRGLGRTDIPSTGSVAKVFIVCSLAGGTGSGMYLDITYMVRKLLADNRITGFVTGLLVVDPSPFSEIVHELSLQRRMEANIYAALCELDWLMGGHQSDEITRKRSQISSGASNAAEHGPSGSVLAGQGARYQLQYLDRTRIESDSRPFDVCYLVTSMNENTRRLREVSSLTAMIAHEIFLEIATPLGRTGRSALDNVERLSSFSDYRARPLAYSSLAVASLNLTPRLVQDKFVLDLAKHTLDRLVQPGDSPIAPDDPLRAALSQLPLSADQLEQMIEQVTLDRPDFSVMLRYPAQTRGESYRTEANELRKRIDGQIKGPLQARYSEVQAQLIEHCRRTYEELLHRLLGRMDVSLAQVNTLVNQHLQQCSDVLSDAQDQHKKARATVEHEGKRTQQQSAQLDQAAAMPERQFILIKTNKDEQIRLAALALLENVRALSEAHDNELYWRTAVAIVNGLTQLLSAYRGQLPQLEAECRQLLRKVQLDQETNKQKLEKGSNQYQLEFEALDAADLERQTPLFWQHIQPHELGAVLMQRPSGDRSDEPNRLVRYLLQIVTRNGGVNTLQRALHEKSGGDTTRLERQLKKLAEYAEPFCHLDLTKCPEVAQWSMLSLIGLDGGTSADGNSHVAATLTKVIDRFVLVNTNDPNRIDFLKTKHGLPLFALSVTNGRMRRSYHEYRQGWLYGDASYRPVHITQAWANIQDLHPSPKIE